MKLEKDEWIAGALSSDERLRPRLKVKGLTLLVSA